METFPRYWPLVWGIHRSPMNSPQKDQWRRALMFSLIRASINGWVNNGEAGDLRRHRAHYDVIISRLPKGTWQNRRGPIAFCWIIPIRDGWQTLDVKFAHNMYIKWKMWIAYVGIIIVIVIVIVIIIIIIIIVIINIISIIIISSF